MNFKKPKDQVVAEADSAAMNVLYNSFSYIKGNMQHGSPSSTMDQIQFGIQNAIREAIRSLVENVYTDAEFEKDIGLKD